jgi:putative PEP-CTERM system histidine kinase
VPILKFISLAAALIAGAAALAVLFRARRSLASRLFAVGMLLLGAEAALSFLSFRVEVLGELLYWQKLRFVPLSLAPVVWVAFSLVYSRGNYQEYLARWRNALLALALLPPVLLALGSRSLLTATLEATEAVFWSLELGWAAQATQFVLVATAVLVLMNLEQTFRSSVGTQRWRLKFVILGLGALFGARVYTASQALLFREVIEHMGLLNSVALIVACVFVAISLSRTGGFAIDIYPSQAALHRSVVVMVVGAYLVVVGLLAKLANWLGSTSGFDFQLNALIVFLALVLLALGLMSDQLRARSHAWLNRHFRRPHYDYRQVWNGFTTATAGHATEPAACAALAKWVLEEGRQELQLAGTTLDPDQLSASVVREKASDWPAVIQSVGGLTQTTNLDVESTALTSPLLQLQPRVFPNGGARLAVPLTSGDNSLGVMVVGDRISGVPFTSEDKELLQIVAAQAAGLLRAIRLSRRLLEAREMEAFQSMSTFFVHDLKNTASSLSLMLQNLPRHFDNPEFREDALRSIRKSVERINQMIESLSALRRKLVVEPRLGNLADLRPHAEQLARERGIDLQADFQPAGPVRMDRAQLERVLTNLIVNAHQASADGQPIIIRTTTDNGTARLIVEDRGCGMTADFLQRQLFRPFQTTKKTGTGIGLYHCKLIVDAHGGRMEVQSQPGQGTRISMVLPLNDLPDEARRIDRR